MTLCAACGHDRPVGAVGSDGTWRCGACDPAGSVAMHRNRGNGIRSPFRQSRRS
jgi:hypothetical protein